MLIVFLSLPVSAQVQKEKKARQLFDVVLKVVDENGAPVTKANVVVGEGITHAETDNAGSVTFKGYPDDVVTITSPFYEKVVSPVIDLVQNPTVTLTQSKIQMTSDDEVPLPFTSVKKRFLTGPEVVIPGEYFAHYPSTDIRAALTGLTSLWDIKELNGSPGLSSLEGLQSYSNLTVSSFGATDKFGNVPYILVDNVPVDIQELNIDPGEIESATLIKGIMGTAMFGPAATGGVIYIKTKRGAKNEHILNLNVESGVSVVDRMPEYVSGAVYARLNDVARINSGLPKKYSSDAIAAYANNDGYNLQYPNTNYKDLMLKNTMPFTRVNMSASGGNDIVQYYSYLGYAGQGDMIKIGPVSNYTRLTARQTVSIKINDKFSALINFAGDLNFRKAPNYGYNSNYTTEGTSNSTATLTEVPSILNDIHTTPPTEFPIWAYFDTTSNTPWYGVSATYSNNPIGNLVDNGFYTDKGRTGATNIALSYDFGDFIKGLKSTTFFGFNIHNLVRLGKENDYMSYNVAVNPLTGVVTRTRNTAHTLAKMSDMYKLMDYYFQRYSFYENLTYDRTFGNSKVLSSLTFNGLMTYINGVEEPQRQRNVIWSSMYSFKDKYTLEAVLDYSGTAEFDKNYRNGLFPVVGAGWVISDEGFMPKWKFLDFLKLRAQYGVVGNETYFPNLYYVDRWSTTSTTSTSTPYGFGPYLTSQWFGSTTEANVTRTYLSRSGNPILTWEKRRELNFGFDAQMFNNRLNLGVTYYNWLVDGSLSQVSNVIPLLAGYNGARPYYNYNQTRYHAVGADFTFTDKIGEFEYSIGGNITAPWSERIKYDQPNYRFDYQTRIGKPSDAIFGQTYIGKFTTDAEALIVPQLFDNVLHAGDLKYQDMNSDGVIDDNDQSMIGHSSPRLIYAVNISLKYKNFDLFILGAGRAFFDIALNNPYYWNGWGDNNYSKFVQENAGGAYPNLTYYKVNNNFVLSNFWLTRGDYFKIQNVELGYTIPAKMLQFMGGRAIRIYVSGANLLTFTKVKDVDPETIYTGDVNGTSTNLCGGVNAYPLFRTFAGGVKFNF